MTIASVHERLAAQSDPSQGMDETPPVAQSHSHGRRVEAKGRR
ncbi:MAG TPA: hypothetical protein VKB13_08515 [Gaiellaceae bacterium]|nr:hypothetical protein [Gaiellaceae bacterium]